MESGVYGLPSIITSNIETLENDVYSQKSKQTKKKLLKNLKIAQWSTSKRKLIGEKTKSFFNNYKEKVTNFLEKLKISYRDI